MAKGGARTRSGPAPDPMALRRDRPSDQAEWTILPRAGRAGDPPRFPLPKPVARELALWAEVWSRPQAVAWEAEGDDHLLVAVYVRRFTEAELRGATAAATTIVRQLADELGLTASGMARRRWRLAQDEIAQQRERKKARPATSRDRLKVVRPAADGG